MSQEESDLIALTRLLWSNTKLAGSAFSAGSEVPARAGRGNRKLEVAVSKLKRGGDVEQVIGALQKLLKVELPPKPDMFKCPAGNPIVEPE
ncbi:hypothetical protein CDL15_Pgr014660 [Punica granatum]|uniref:Uncharacterized protein n=1 Tax=Punica granatum TaxID=22663 RepID=A0A218XZX6_PUNGR|nr:hypothetical protein CDL15_Pgr014660 [Punica granatum]PKI32475.1 hypothetical protein CRG98_047137 [Punica granatum]